MEAQQFQPGAAITGHPAWTRLEDQLAYYTAKSRRFQLRYRAIKILEIALGALVPVLAFQDCRLATALCGSTIAVAEAVLHLNQYATLWVEYRGTAERLKREKWLLLARAGEYRGLDDRAALLELAERVEMQLGGESAKWVDGQRSAARSAPPKIPPTG